MSAAANELDELTIAPRVARAERSKADDTGARSVFLEKAATEREQRAAQARERKPERTAWVADRRAPGPGDPEDGDEDDDGYQVGDGYVKAERRREWMHQAIADGILVDHGLRFMLHAMGVDVEKEEEAFINSM
jgi:hypothetical protein